MCCSSICTLVQFVFVPVQNILNWYKIFCASPIFNFIVQFVVNLQYSFIFWSTCLPWISFSSTVVSFHWQSSLVTFHKPEPRVSGRVRKDSGTGNPLPAESVCGNCIFVISFTIGKAWLSSTILGLFFASLSSNSCCWPSESLFQIFSEIWSFKPDWGV